MRKRGRVFLILLILLGVGCALLLGSFFSIQGIRGDELLVSSDSPDGVYTVTAYRNNGGATTDFAILGVARHNATGHTRNIYWQYHKDYAHIVWLDNVTVEINGVELDVRRDVYDYRDQQ